MEEQKKSFRKLEFTQQLQSVPPLFPISDSKDRPEKNVFEHVFRKAQKLLSGKNYSEALKVLENFETEPMFEFECADCLMLKCESLYCLGRYNEALRIVEIVMSLTLQIRTAEKLSPMLNNLRKIYASVGHQDFEKTTQVQELNVRVNSWGLGQFNLGITHYKSKDYQTALEIFGEIADHNPKIVEAWFYRGLMYEELEEKERAEISYQEALKLRPHWRAAERALSHIHSHDYLLNYYYKKGLLYQAAGQEVQALAMYKRAMSYDNALSPEVWENLGEAFRQLRQFKEAVIAFDHSLAINPTMKVCCRKGQTLEEQAKQLGQTVGQNQALYLQALQAYASSLQYDREQFSSWQDVVRVLQILGKTDDFDPMAMPSELVQDLPPPKVAVDRKTPRPSPLLQPGGIRQYLKMLDPDEPLIVLIDLKIDAEGMQALADELKKRPACTSLHLRRNQIDQDGFRLLAQIIKDNRSLTILDLEGNSIEDTDAVILGRALKENWTLKELSIPDLRSDFGLRVIGGALDGNSSLVKMNLPPPVVPFAVMNARIHASIQQKLAENSAEKQWITKNKEFKYERDRKSISRPFPRDSAENLSVELFAEILQPTITMDVRVLALSGREIGNTTFSLLMAKLKVAGMDRVLTKIDLSDNFIDDAGVQILADFLATNPALRELDLRDNAISPAGIQALTQALTTNTRLITLRLNDAHSKLRDRKVSVEEKKQNLIGYQSSVTPSPQKLPIDRSPESSRDGKRSKIARLYPSFFSGKVDEVKGVGDLLDSTPMMSEEKRKHSATALEMEAEEFFKDIEECGIPLPLCLSGYVANQMWPITLRSHVKLENNQVLKDIDRSRWETRRMLFSGEAMPLEMINKKDELERSYKEFLASSPQKESPLSDDDFLDKQIAEEKAIFEFLTPRLSAPVVKEFMMYYDQEFFGTGINALTEAVPIYKKDSLPVAPSAESLVTNFENRGGTLSATLLTRGFKYLKAKASDSSIIDDSKPPQPVFATTGKEEAEAMVVTHYTKVPGQKALVVTARTNAIRVGEILFAAFCDRRLQNLQGKKTLIRPPAKDKAMPKSQVEFLQKVYADISIDLPRRSDFSGWLDRIAKFPHTPEAAYSVDQLLAVEYTKKHTRPKLEKLRSELEGLIEKLNFIYSRNGKKSRFSVDPLQEKWQVLSDTITDMRQYITAGIETYSVAELANFQAEVNACSTEIQDIRVKVSARYLTSIAELNSDEDCFDGDSAVELTDIRQDVSADKTKNLSSVVTDSKQVVDIKKSPKNQSLIKSFNKESKYADPVDPYFSMLSVDGLSSSTSQLLREEKQVVTAETLAGWTIPAQSILIILLIIDSLNKRVKKDQGMIF